MSAVEPLYTSRGVALRFAVVALFAAVTLVLYLGIGRFVVNGGDKLCQMAT